MNEERELTGIERKSIRKLVASQCANYDSLYGCLPLEDSCCMLDKCWTGAFCKYFKNAVLPNDPKLESSLDRRHETRECAFCGDTFPANGKKAYCSERCANEAKKRQKREHIRKRRAKCRKIAP